MVKTAEVGDFRRGTHEASGIFGVPERLLFTMYKIPLNTELYRCNDKDNSWQNMSKSEK